MNTELNPAPASQEPDDNLREIALESPGLVRKVKGRWLASWDDTNQETGVIQAKSGMLIYWSDFFGASIPETPTYREFRDLEDLQDSKVLEVEQLAEVADALDQKVVVEIE